MKQQIEANPSVFIRPNVDSLVVGNWMDDNFCSTLGKYDTILADYLIGAVDGFSPYEQDTIIGRQICQNQPSKSKNIYFYLHDWQVSQSFEPSWAALLCRDESYSGHYRVSCIHCVRSATSA